MARIMTWDKSPFRDGAMAPNPPRVIPMDPILEKPQRAYVAITTDLSYRNKYKHVLRFY